VARAITQQELRNSIGEIMRALERGESFVVTRNGVPVGELTPTRRASLRSTPSSSTRTWTG
jgi:prevent-host-death family protein